MRLQHLIDGLDLALVHGSGAVEVSDITDDSRQVRPGALFVARGGAKADGRAYIADALTRGAAAVIAAQGVSLPDAAARASAALAQAPRVDQALAGALAERFFGNPARRLTVVGVTGTKGKTTVAFLVQHLLQAAGRRCGLIGTVYIDDGQARRPAELTTPGAIDFSRHLAAMVAQGCQAVVAEFSSHALHQGRTAALPVRAAVFTNLTHEHLDYHSTMEAYADAKAILFRSLAPDAVAVVNVDDRWSGVMLRGCRARVLGCALGAGAPQSPLACRADVLELGRDATRAAFSGPWGSFEVRLPLVGRHNVMNALQAAAAAWAVTGRDAATLASALAAAPSPPGRLEPVSPAVAPFPTPTVLVDYAHTHDALEKALEALRPLTRGRLIVLFGCGGDRDRDKRPLMAGVACRRADRVVITSDNPRTEDPGAIICDILKGVPSGMTSARCRTPNGPQDGGLAGPAAADVAFDPPQSAVLVQPDRAAAIRLAIGMAGPDDVVLLAGKGHEDYQIIGTTKRPFDDRQHAAAALRAWVQRRAAGGAA